MDTIGQTKVYTYFIQWQNVQWNFISPPELAEQEDTPDSKPPGIPEKGRFVAKKIYNFFCCA